MPRRRSRSTPASRDFHSVPDLVIEVAWLLGLVTVPLFLNPRGWLTFYNDPKYFALHLVALVILTTWAWERALFSRPAGLPGLSECREWVGRRPERWALVAAGALGATAVLSTVASPVKLVSLWGRDYVDLGYELYSFLAFLVIFFAIALRVRSVSRLRRTLWMIVAVGTVAAMYGMAQRHGWDPIGSGEGAARIASSFGNPIQFGSFLVLTALITPAVTLAEARDGRRWWLALGILAFSVQLIALYYTGSRGPWLGFAAGVLAFGVLGFLTLDRKDIVKSGVIVGAAIAIALLIGQIPLSEGEGGGERTLADVGRIFEETSSGTVGGRGEIWASALDVGIARPWSPEEATGTGLIRMLFGYGPDTFFYAYPMGVGIDYTGSIAQHTHNYPLHIFMELGLLGLVSLLALALLALYAAASLLTAQRRAGQRDAFATLVIIGLIAALAGRSVEQMAGVARLGDLVPFWVMLGLLIAAVEIFRTNQSQGEAATEVERRTAPRRRDGSRQAAYILVAVAVSVAALGLLWGKDVRMIQASVHGRNGAVLGHEGQVNRALDEYTRAVELNPYVQQFHMTINDMFRRAASEAEDEGDEELAVKGWELALDAAQNYSDRNPKAFEAQARLGQAQSRLVGLGRTDLVGEARSTYLNFAGGRPTYPIVQALASQGFLAIGDDVLGLVYADRALEMETANHPDARSWWFRGVALNNLGQIDAAIESYLNAIQRGPESQFALNAHEQLAALYGSRGEPEKAAEQQALADQFVR